MKTDTDTPDPHVPSYKDTEIVEEARKRYRLAHDWAKDNIEKYKAAMRFVALDQWEPNLKAWRESKKRPCLTMDRLGTHINQAVNDIRQSKPALKAHPASGEASVEAAEVIDGLFRNIEYSSTAPQIYVKAAFTQISGGQGAWRVLTRYVDEMSFDQEIYLAPIEDPTSVLFEPGPDPTGCDASYGFVVSTMSMDDFKRDYPGKNPANWTGIIDPEGWWSEKTVRLAEYYRIHDKKTEIHLMDDGSVVDDDMLKKMTREMPMASTVPAPAVVKSRPTTKKEVQWFKLGGSDVLDARIVPSKYIPLIKVVGNCVLIDDKPVVTGLTHRAMDPQRMYNYQTSVVVELLSLQKTAPWVGAAGQFEGFESEWDNANINNPARLEYNPIDINGVLAPVPKREMPPQVPTGNVQAMELAAQDLQWVTGQHAANFGAKSNETSGVAIRARQMEGDTATYHYLDNLGNGILRTGRIIIDMLPRVVDTKRALRIMGEDMTSKMVKVDPQQQRPVQKAETLEGKVEKIFNLGLGKYDVTVSVGPSFGTRRLEAVDAMSELLRGNPELWQAIGDLYIGNQDWPGAQDMAKRLKKMLPPQLQENEGEDPEAQMQAQIGQMNEALQQADMMMQQRDQALEQASQQLDQMQQELATLKEQSLKAATDIEAKTRVADVSAQAEVRVAELNASVEAMKAIQEASRADVELLRSMLQDFATKPEGEMGEGSEEGAEVETGPSEEQLLAQILERLALGQEQMQQIAATMLESQQARPVGQRQFNIERDEMGNIARISEGGP